MNIFKQLKWFFISEKKSYILGISLLTFVAFLELIPPRVIGIIIDLIDNNTLSRSELLKWASLLIIIAVTLYISRYFWRNQIFGASLRLSRHFRNELYKHYTLMSPSFYQKYKTGDLMAHATNDIHAIQQTVGVGILTLVDSLVLGGFVLLTMAFTISWKLTLICLIPMPIMVITTNYYSSLIHKRFTAAQEAFSSLNDRVLESINGIKVIKAMGQEDQDSNRFNKESMDVVQKNIAVAKIDALFDPTIYFIVAISLLLAIVYGSKYVNNGELTIGQLISFTTYLGYLIWPMLAFGWLFNIVERGRASYIRIQNLLSQKTEVSTTMSKIELSLFEKLNIKINRFNYPTLNSFTLKNVNINLNNGETLGIVGRTGSGKTTLIRLILRQYDAIDGCICVNNIDIKQYNLCSLRKFFSYVPQDNFLFSATVFENIAFAKPNASKSEVEEVAKIANIHHDILDLADGYQTLVGERGVSISGGQKQRISIARALLVNADVLLLDDCLSAVDARTEEKILNAIKENRKGKTTIIVSHRMSTVQHVNQIIVLDNGELIDEGTHSEIISKDSWYREMFERQQLEIEVNGER
jgi:ATP-binding cassette subfamily B protein